MPMETEKPTTGSGGNTGLSDIAIIGVTALVLSFIGIVLGILDCLFGGALFRNRISSWLEKRRNSDPRSSDAENPPSHNPPSEVPLIDQTKMGDQTFYDIYLVSTSEQTPQVDKIKDMCRKNEWKFTTPFGGKLGVLPMQSVQEAVETCSHVVLVITKDDCSKKNLKYSMTIEMAFESVENGELRSKVIPIRCCDRASLPLMLRSLQGSTIGEDDLEERMIKTIDKGIRMKREGQCQSVSGAQGVRDGADVAGGRDIPDSASAAISDTM